METPPLGFIKVADRTPQQHAAHAMAVASMSPIARYFLPLPTLKVGQRVSLTAMWKHPDVVADVTFPFKRIWQKTGSCVWAGAMAALMSTIAAQRVAGSSPRKAFFPFALHNYADSRHRMGDDSQGEGSLGSTFAESLEELGIRDWPDNKEGLPDFNDEDDAYGVSGSVEMAWSSIRNPKIKDVLPIAKEHRLGKALEVRSIEDLRRVLLNGYGVSFACDRFIGNASVQGTGDEAVLIGSWDSNGGHQQSIHDVWEHPRFGPLYWVQNNWPSSSYPKDPAGGPTCGCWVLERKVEEARRNYHSEVYGFSDIPWFPANPSVVDFSQL